MILDIGLPVVMGTYGLDSIFSVLDILDLVIPLNTRVLAGLFQSIAVRASVSSDLSIRWVYTHRSQGFGIVSLNSLAPSVK